MTYYYLLKSALVLLILMVITKPSCYYSKDLTPCTLPPQTPCTLPPQPPPPPGPADPNLKEAILPLLLIYKNGTIVRAPDTFALLPPTYRPKPNPNPATGVMFTNITVNPFTNLTARLYVQTSEFDGPTTLPIVLHFHGGAFIMGSAFVEGQKREYLERVASQGKVILISINYRLFPEYALPAAYEDGWDALRWVSNQRPSSSSSSTTRWLSAHGDFNRVFLTGDSAGANIVHNLAMRAADEPLPNDVSIRGIFLATPYFLGSAPIPLGPCYFRHTAVYQAWKYVCPADICPHGVDDPVINPIGPGAPTLARLATRKVMVYTAELDDLRGRGILYADSLQVSGWKGELLRFEAKGQNHVFHLRFDQSGPRSSSTALLVARFAQFLQT